MTFFQWLASSGATVVLLGTLGYIFRKWFLTRITESIKHEYDLLLESHKANLKRDYDVQIVQLTAQLQIANVRFAHIFVKQAEAIVATHQKIIPLLASTNKYIHAVNSFDLTNKAASTSELQSLREDFHSFFLLNRIYIPPTTAKLVDKFVGTVNAYVNKTSMLNTMISMQNRSEHLEKQIDKYGTEVDDLDVEVNNIMNALVADFQNILGIQKENTKEI